MTADLPTTKDQFIAVLDILGLSYELYEHEPIFTVEQGVHLKESIPGTHCRNLFLRDKKKKMFLIVAANETMAQPLVNYHPMDNAWTIGMSPDGVIRFIEHTGHTAEIVDLSQAAPDV